MTRLGPPDAFVVRAAEGWLALGNPGEARLELARVSPGNARHPEVLETACRVSLSTADWERAHAEATELVRLHPGMADGWLHRSYAARRRPGGGLADALEALRPAADLFPEHPTVAFNLACYEAQSGRPDAAWTWYLEAVRRGDADAVRRAALADPDLEPIRARISAG